MNEMTIMGAGVSLYAHINLTNNCEKLLQFTL